MAETPIVTPDPLKDALKAKAEAETKVRELKLKARKAIAEAEKAKAEAEAVLYANWKPGSDETRPVNIPMANFVSGAQPKLNGRELVGIKEMTYDAYRGMMHSLSFREWQETCAKKGYFKGQTQINDLAGNIRLVDNWDPKAEGLLEYSKPG